LLDLITRLFIDLALTDAVARVLVELVEADFLAFRCRGTRHVTDRPRPPELLLRPGQAARHSEV
jgi:hypothetical protein